MNKKIWLITHGLRHMGANPVHTKEGLEQIRNLPLPQRTPLAVSGTGARFLEILEIVQEKCDVQEVKYSPFCGSVDGLENDGNVVLVDGTLVNLKNDYLSLSQPCFDAWAFVESLSDGTILCAGGELYLALGLDKNIKQYGGLYCIDVAGRGASLVQ